MKSLNKKYILSMILSVVVLSFLIACGNASIDSSNNEEKLIMGLDDTFAPMGFRNAKGELDGFDIDLSRAVAKKLGVNIELQPIEWSMKEAELNTGNIDLIWNGYSIDEVRKTKVAFSTPYLANRQIVVTLADANIDVLDDLKGLVVAVQAESSAIGAAYSKEGFVESLKNGKMIEFGTNNEAFNDLEAGRSDAVVVDEVLARYYMKQNGEEKYKILEEDLGDEEFGIGMRKEDTQLVKDINRALKELREDGTYDEIYDKWFSDK